MNINRYDCIRFFGFFFHDTATTEIYTYLHTLSLHDALPISYHAGLEINEVHVRSAGRVHDGKFADRFPNLTGVKMQYRWGGPMALTWNSVPILGEIEPGLFAAFACRSEEQTSELESLMGIS